ncbi:MAG TPA: exodeoxyribonuclease VII large subunit, partial [Clostridiales bacterium]|nr:exodeoxyribonuclease VII large subunit [Clostridiales bacterium]
MNEQRSLTVSQLNTLIKDYLDNFPMLKNVYVKGEISNLKIYGGSGHLYFTLKDADSCLKAVMFGGAGKLKFRPEDGMKVLCRGRIAVFVRDGTYQLYTESMEPDGLGSLYIAFEQLKAKLESEGLFAAEHKKKLPKVPFRIGIITAPTGAAVRDMINVTGRRFPAAKIIIYPSQVQGENAPAQLIKALRYMDENNLADVIIIGR